jgi:dUTP pyrophosphatase
MARRKSEYNEVENEPVTESEQDVINSESNDSTSLGDFSTLVPLNVVDDDFELPALGVYTLSPTAQIPEYSTEGSACFDLRADLTGLSAVTVYNNRNQEVQRIVRGSQGEEIIVLDPGDRVMVPTNIIFDIPEDYKILIYPRSGLSLKKGIRLANSVGVVDSDFIDPAMILVYNASRVGVTISQGERLAQAEMVPVTKVKFNKMAERPAIKTSRNGGFGSTD